MSEDATRSHVRCYDSKCWLPLGHKGDHYDGDDGRYWENHEYPRATPDCVAKLALAVSDAFEAYTKEPTPYNEGLLQGLQLAADIIGKNP